MKRIRLWGLVCVSLALLGCSGVQTYPVPTEVRSGDVSSVGTIYRYTVYEDYPRCFHRGVSPFLGGYGL